MIRNEIVLHAKDLAYKAHKHQTRNDKVTPYIVHPEAVCHLVNVSGLVYEQRLIVWAACWLHDVIEDTYVTVEDLNNMGFPEELVKLVYVLTHDKMESYYDYIMRVKEYPLAIRVKLADLEHNLSDLKKGSLRDKYQLTQHILEEEL